MKQEEKRQAAKEILEAIRGGEIGNKDDLSSWKKKVAADHKLDGLVANSAVIKLARERGCEVPDLLKRKPTRTISGLANVAVMWHKEDSCPGHCIYCPRGDDAPQSYTGKEPAARRARRNNYDPYQQVVQRLEQLRAIGHPTDKCQLIVMGGTFPAAPRDFQQQFIKRCYDGFNDKRSSSLQQAKEINETADNRVVGLTIETRPDYSRRSNINSFLEFGGTRVELGVQTLNEETYQRIKRGHGLTDVIAATRSLKNAAFKVNYHLMLGLPGETKKDDREKFSRLFSDSRFRPDELKIYPTEVIQGTELYKLYQEGNYHPLTEEELLELLIDIKQKIPPWVRIKRIMRDVPSTEVDAGPARTNMRQLVRQEMEKRGIRCRCIRCREAGHVKEKRGEKPETVELVKRDYQSTGGKEVFLSFEDKEKDIILAYLRLRLPTKSFRDEINENTSLVRELKVVGPSIPLDEREDGTLQHRGLGSKLLERAEALSREQGYETVLVIAGVGVRQYYRKHGYERVGPYMGKDL